MQCGQALGTPGCPLPPPPFPAPPQGPASSLWQWRHSFVAQIFSRSLLCARPCSSCQGYDKNETEKGPCSWGAHTLLGGGEGGGTNSQQVYNAR